MNIKSLTWTEFVAHFDSEVHDALELNRKKLGVDGIAVLECHVMDSSKLGRVTALIYGPACTYKSVEQMAENKAGIYVDGLPSSASFPIAYTTEVPNG
jgi:hypothetical protein